MATAKEINALIKRVPIRDLKRKEVKVTKKATKVAEKIGIDPRQIELIPRKPVTRTNRKDFSGNGHWSFDKEMGQGKTFGFIYVIRDLRNGKGYIGKKQYTGQGSVNLGVASNWPWYISSRDTLVEQIKVHGKDNFEFIVLEEYSSDKALGYAEVWSLMRAETPANQDKWYNRLVNKVSWFCKEQITSKHKQRLDAIINGLPLEVAYV